MMFDPKGRALQSCVVAVTALSFMQIGYDNGLMGGLVTTNAFNKTFNKPSSNMVSVIVAIFEVGAFFGAVTSAFFGERLGRRVSIAIGTAVMIIGALLQATAYARSHLIVARIVAGFGLGITNSTGPVLQSEFSPKSNRGLFVCVQLTTLNFATALVYWIDFAFNQDGNSNSYSWRVPCILQCVFLIPMLLFILVIPETPRWLASHDRREESLAVLRRLRGFKEDDETIVAIHKDIVATAAWEKSIGAGSWRDLVKNDRIRSQRRLLTACAVQIFQQLGGINAIIYYSPTLFQSSLGFDQHTSSLMAGCLQTWFFVASFIPWVLIDRIGRRPLFLSMISLMAAVMAAQAGLVRQVQYNTSVKHAAGAAAAAMLFIFQGAFTIGFQATVWVYPTEVLPLRLRQRGSSISTAANWICNYAVVQFTPPAISNIGYKTYIIFAILNATWVPIIYLFFPETKGLELEAVDRIFDVETANPVKESLKAERRAVAPV